MSPPATSLWENLAISAQRYPEKAAILFFGRAHSYSEVFSHAERLAARLHALGVKRGDRVILCMQNCPQLVISHFAVLRANAVVVPVNPMNQADELGHYITDADARVAITTGDLAFELAAASDALPTECRLRHMIVTNFTDAFDPDAQGVGSPPDIWREWLVTRHPVPVMIAGTIHEWCGAMKCQFALPPLEVGPEDLAILPYTSGTTGTPKGCMLSHANFMHNAVASRAWNAGTAEDVALTVNPFFHVAGMLVMHAMIYSGATIVLMPRWNRQVAAHLISHHNVTTWFAIPTMVIDLLGSPLVDQYELSSLRYIGGGGAAMPEAVAQRLFDVFGLRYIEGYGLTETAAPSHFNPPDHPKQQCLGIPFMSCDARVIDPGTMREVGPGELGEIIISGPMVFAGYWKRPEATAAALIEFDGRTFFRSGDLGRMDEDGYFFLTDRLKRMINASGFKVWPAEVEALMFGHPAIQEVCVISAPDSYRGETVKALVVLRPDQLGQVCADDIVAWCRQNMATYKAPRLIDFVDALPKSASGKVMWRSLQEAENANGGSNVAP